MRVLVISDSHGSTKNMRVALLRESSAQVIIHLGDGSDDLLLCPNEVGSRRVILLKGNVDSETYGAVPSVTTELEGVTIFACHGDRYAVRNSTNTLEYAALAENASILLFGHTHAQYYRYDGGLHVINPGAMKDGNYAVLDIRKEGILCNHMHL